MLGGSILLWRDWIVVGAQTTMARVVYGSGARSGLVMARFIYGEKLTDNLGYYRHGRAVLMGMSMIMDKMMMMNKLFDNQTVDHSC